ncbi:hypothetical protein ACUHMQ_14270 [Chitinimonas sp. PSY-7]|uniref:hypothetical protein n=1 Tax=Chitinimonas sp. PSY-7 TaxID=3459088 RepID=UPI00403FE6E1
MPKSFTRIVNLSQSSKWLDAALKTQLLPLLEDSFAGISGQDYLQKYFLKDGTFERKLRLYFDNEKLVGYCLLTFSKIDVDKKNIICIGASAAFYPAYRHGSNTIAFSVSEAVKYWLLHPWSSVCYADTMLSPAMYRAVAKKVAFIYPSAERVIPANLLALVKKLKEAFSVNLPAQVDIQGDSPFICFVGRKTNYSQSEIHSFRVDKKPEIQYYCQVNPNFDQGNALITVVPVNMRQMLEMIVKWIKQ